MAAKEENLTQKDAMAHISLYAGLMFPVVGLSSWFTYNFLPWVVPPLATASDRLVYTLQWHGLSVAVLYNMLENVMHERSRTAWNPLDQRHQEKTAVLGRILSNTVEQFIMFATSTLILSTYLNEGQMKIIPIFVVIWVMARLFFDYGYKISPLYRGPGFSATMIPTMAVLTMIAYFQFYQGPWLLSLASGYFCVRRLYLFLFTNEVSPLIASGLIRS